MLGPKWLQLSERLSGPLFTCAGAALAPSESSDIDASLIPHLALFHLYHCLNASIVANREAKYSVAVCLLRQCVETLTIIDLGLQNHTYRDPLLHAWKDGKKSHGEIRRALEQDVWPRYEHGLWDESWRDYFANLAKAVQPYAHYTPELMGWQMAIRASDGGEKLIVETGESPFDAVRTSRITLLQALVVWTLGRLLVENTDHREAVAYRALLDDLRKALGTSKLLFKGREWADELVPFIWFKPGVSWQDQ